MSDLGPRSVEPSNRIFGPLFVRIASVFEFLSSGFVGTDPHRPTYYNRPRDTEGERMCGAIWLLGTIRTELKRQREKANSLVVQVVQLESLLERLRDCRTVPYLRFFLVRNEEVVGSNPINLVHHPSKGNLECASWEQPLRSGKEKIRFVWLLRRIAVREILVEGG
jgi:hypothetical protein